MAGLLESSKQSSKNHEDLMDFQNYPPLRRRKHSSNETKILVRSEIYHLSALILELYIFIDLNHRYILFFFFSFPFVGSIPFGSSIIL